MAHSGRFLVFFFLITSFFQLSLASHKSHHKIRALVDHRLKEKDVVIADWMISNMERSQNSGGFHPKSPTNFESRMVDGVARVLPRIGPPTKRSAPKAKRSAIPGTTGYIQATSSDGSIYNIVGLNADGSYQLGPSTTAPTPFTIPAACPAPRFDFQDSSLHYLGATVDASRPLSPTTTNPMKRDLIQKRDVTSTATAPVAATTLSPSQLATLTPTQIIAYNVYQQIIATELLVVTTIKYTQYAAVVAITVAAQAAYDAITLARNGPPTVPPAPQTAADLTALNAFNAASTTAVNAAYLQAYKACVAAAAQRQNAITAYGATLTNPLDPSSIQTAADAAALAVATAALAAQGLDPVASSGTGCAAQNSCILTSLSGSASTQCLNDIQIKLVKIKIAAAQANSATVVNNAAILAPVTTSTQTGGPGSTTGTTGSTTSTSPGTQGPGAIWTFPNCNPTALSNPMTAIYTNQDGSKVAPVTFFISAGNAIGATGNYAAYSSANPQSVGRVLTLNYIRTS